MSRFLSDLAPQEVYGSYPNFDSRLEESYVMEGCTTSENRWNHHILRCQFRKLAVHMQRENQKILRDCFMRHQGTLYSHAH
jgi:hypothetical protein